MALLTGYLLPTHWHSPRPDVQKTGQYLDGAVHNEPVEAARR